MNKVGALGSRCCSCLDCLPSCLWLVAESPLHPWQAVCCLSLLPGARLGAGPSCGGAEWGAPFPSHRGSPCPAPHHPLGFSIPLHHLSSWALALLGCLPERSMKQAVTVSIMGVNEANFRAPERLTSSLSLTLGPQVGGDTLGFSEFHSESRFDFCLPLHPPAHCNDFQPLPSPAPPPVVKGSPWGFDCFQFCIKAKTTERTC